MNNRKRTSPSLNTTFTMKTSSLSCEDLEDLLRITQEEGELQNNPFHFEEASTQTTVTEKKLGEGGYGTIFVGKQNMPNREIAIKILHKDSEEERRNLLKEANIIGRLEHPNIIPIHEVHIDDENNVQIIMKKIQGNTLKDLVDKIKDPEKRIKQGAEVLIQVCYALEFAHAAQILHRDIKCPNIMIGPFNEVYLMDWGLALDMTNRNKITDKIVGTPTHLAPEMLSANLSRLDERTDIFLLGATLHYILVLQSRHNGKTLQKVVELAKCSEPADYPDFVPQIFADITNKACSRNPSERFKNVRDFRKSLEKAKQIWDALKIIQRAQDKAQFLESLKLDHDFAADDLFQIQNSFANIISTYEAAAEIFPDLPEAVQGIQKMKTIMIDFYLSQNRPLEAMALYNELTIKNENLKEIILEEIEHLKKEREAKDQLARDRDPKASIEGRKKLVLSSSIGMICLAIGDSIYERLFNIQVTHDHLLIIAGFMVSILLLGIGLGRKTLFVNQIGRELVKTFVMGIVFILMNRVIGKLYDINPNFILSVDILILGTTFGNAPVVKNSYRILLTCFFISSLSVIFKEYSHFVLDLFLISSIVAWLTILFDWFDLEKQER